MRTKLVVCLALLSTSAALAVACSDDETTNGTTSDAGSDRSTTDTGVADTGGKTDSATDSGGGGDADAEAEAGDGCTVINLTPPAAKSTAPGFAGRRITVRIAPNLGELPDGATVNLDRGHFDIWDLAAPVNQARSLSGDNAKGETCKECLAIYEDFTVGDLSKTTFYFAQSGTVTFKTLTTSDGGVDTVKAEFANVRLDQVTMDDGLVPHGKTTKVTGGKCLRINASTIEFPNPPADGGTDAASDAPDGGG
jgi:hypothetical protein